MSKRTGQKRLPPKYVVVCCPLVFRLCHEGRLLTGKRPIALLSPPLSEPTSQRMNTKDMAINDIINFLYFSLLIYDGFKWIGAGLYAHVYTVKKWIRIRSRCGKTRSGKISGSGSATLLTSNVFRLVPGVQTKLREDYELLILLGVEPLLCLKALQYAFPGYQEFSGGKTAHHL